MTFDVSRLPVSLRILLESVLPNVDGRRIRDADIETLARCQPRALRTEEVPFVVGRVLLQDFTGVPLLVGLAAMRSAMAERGLDVTRVQPSIPVDLMVLSHAGPRLGTACRGDAADRAPHRPAGSRPFAGADRHGDRNRLLRCARHNALVLEQVLSAPHG